MSRLVMLGSAVLLGSVAFESAAQAQQTSSPVQVPEITVNAGASQGGSSLTAPNTAQATAEIERTPGAVAIVPDTVFKNGPASTVKDILDWVPGVIAQPRWGPDARLSIRGSGLSRSYGNRGLNPMMDGIPISTADGLFDLYEIDPSAYRYVEVFKGANALRYGGNSLGGAINFVMPTGRDASAFDSRVDAGSFGYLRGQSSTAGSKGPYDWFITGSAQSEMGYREHSKNHMERLNANFGYQFSPDAETRFYINANSWRGQLPGEVSKSDALNNPRAANPFWVAGNQQRNIDSVRVANKTTLRFDTTTVDFGLFALERRVDHPIFIYYDFRAHDYGGFVRAADERVIGGFRNRFVTGFNVQNGAIDLDNYLNLGGSKGILIASNLWKSQNYTAYAENSFYFLPTVAAILGGQLQRSIRDQQDRFLSNGDQSGRRTYDAFTPKVGLLWDVDPAWQVFGNVSRSSEAPSFDTLAFTTPVNSNLQAQTATTYEIGTRGRRPDLTWDLSLYRATIRNELQCLADPANVGGCTATNAPRTVHQGIEAGLGVAFLKSAFAQQDRFWLNVAYTYSDFRFDGDATFDNNRLPAIPPHYLRAEVVYKHPSGFYAGPNVEWMPQDFFADNANTLTIDPYALVNFKVGFDQGTGWSGYIEGRNLFDKRYISTTVTVGTATPNAQLFNPGAGRAIYAGLRYRM